LCVNLSRKINVQELLMETTLIGRTTTVTISPENPTVIIGERINPTGKKKLAEALRVGNMDFVRQQALLQAECGAQVIDVNVGAVGVDDEEILPRAVETVAEVTGLPCVGYQRHPQRLESESGRGVTLLTAFDRSSANASQFPHLVRSLLSLPLSPYRYMARINLSETAAPCVCLAGARCTDRFDLYQSRADCGKRLAPPPTGYPPSSGQASPSESV
jgi:hypothetical protein